MQHKVQKSLNLLVKSSILVLFGIVISKILTYVHRVIIARYYGVETYGVYSLALVCVGWFIAFASLGLSEGCLRYFAVYHEKKDVQSGRYLMRHSLTFLSVSGLLAGILVFIFSHTIGIGLFNSPDLVVFLRWFSLSIPLTVIALPLIMSIRAYEKIGAYTGIYSVLQNSVKVILLLVLVFAGLGANSAIITSYLLSLAAVLVASHYYVKKNLSSLYVHSVLNENKKSSIRSELLKYSGPMLFYSILVSILYWVDSISLGYYKTPYEVGLYNAAVPLALLIAIVPELFTQLFFPMIARHQASNKLELAKQLTKQVTKWIFAINLPVFIVLFLYPGAVINILFGAEFLPASIALKILAINVLISSVGAVSTTLVSASGKSRLVLMNILAAAVLNLVLNSFLVPMGSILGMDNANGIVGASMATLISIFFLNGLFFYQARKILRSSPFRWKMVLVALSAIIPSIVLYHLSVTTSSKGLIMIGLSGILFGIIYLVNLFIFKAFDKYDLEIIRKIKSRIIPSK